jgi:hypothetical protein
MTTAIVEPMGEEWSERRPFVPRGPVDEASTLAEALERLHGGEYGVCEECGTPITPARVHATPDIVTCLECQLTT